MLLGKCCRHTDILANPGQVHIRKREEIKLRYLQGDRWSLNAGSLTAKGDLSWLEWPKRRESCFDTWRTQVLGKSEENSNSAQPNRPALYGTSNFDSETRAPAEPWRIPSLLLQNNMAVHHAYSGRDQWKVPSQETVPGQGQSKWNLNYFTVADSDEVTQPGWPRHQLERHVANADVRAAYCP